MRAFECKAERLVMSDDYDSVAAGKYQQTQSRWLDEHEERSFRLG